MTISCNWSFVANVVAVNVNSWPIVPADAAEKRPPAWTLVAAPVAVKVVVIVQVFVATVWAYVPWARLKPRVVISPLRVVSPTAGVIAVVVTA